MNQYSMVAAMVIGFFGTIALCTWSDNEVKVVKQEALRECYKAAQTNSKIVCGEQK